MSSLPPPPSSPEVATEEHIGPVADDPRTWGLPDALWVWAAAFSAVSIVVIGGLAAAGYDDIDEAPGWFYFLIQMPFPLGLAAMAALAVGAKGRGIVADLKLHFRTNDSGIGVVVGVITQLALVPAVTYPIVWLFDVDTDEISDSANELADRASGAPAVVMFLVAVVILAPLCEEIFFRGLLFEAFKKRRNAPWLASLWPRGRRPDVDGRRWNLVFAYVASSAIFAVGHFDLLLVPGLMLAGFVFAYLAQRAGRLGPAIWAHFGFNGTTVLALLVLDDDEALPALIRAVIG